MTTNAPSAVHAASTTIIVAQAFLLLVICVGCHPSHQLDGRPIGYSRSEYPTTSVEFRTVALRVRAPHSALVEGLRTKLTEELRTRFEVVPEGEAEAVLSVDLAYWVAGRWEEGLVATGTARLEAKSGAVLLSSVFRGLPFPAHPDKPPPIHQLATWIAVRVR